MECQELGVWGEQLVEAWFQWQGYRIGGRRVQTPFGEVDVWVYWGRRNYLIEVKTRRRVFGPPETFGLTHQKRRTLRRIQWFMKDRFCNRPWCQWMCSFVLVTRGQLLWLPDIFVSFPRFVECGYDVYLNMTKNRG